MTVIKLKLKKKVDSSYKIFIQKNIINELPAFLHHSQLGRKYAIIADTTVKKLFADPLLRYLRKNKIHAEILTFDKGEKSKNLQTIENLAEEMIKKGFDRKDAIIALGGGVAGDIAGFLANMYMRGIPYIQIPTTLLAMVDSSIGGKTGVDLPTGGKNLIGTTYQPKAVFIDINYLKNISDTQIKNGLAEIIKYGVIKDKRLFKFIEQNLEKILAKDEEVLTKIIEKSVTIKAKIVKHDELEHKDRLILNYGHTYGHALEKLSGYKLLHGYAISIGMVIANKIAVEKGILKLKTAERIKNLIKTAGLPITTMKKPTLKDIASDKKKEGDYVKLVLPKKIGKVIIFREKCL